MARIIKGKNPNKPWTVRYFHESRQRERSFATKREAANFIAKFEHDKRESIFVDPTLGKIMFNDYAATWIERRNLADNSKEGYRTVLNAWIAPAFAGRTLAQVAADREAVQELLTVTMPSGTRDRAAVGASRIRQARSLIRGVMNEAVAAGKIPAHKLAGIEAGGAAAKPDVFRLATRDQVTELATGLRPDLALTADLMYGCGLRVSEALAVNIHAFRDGRVLRISEQVARKGSVARLKRRDAGEYRDVPVPAWLWAKVQAHVNRHGTDADGYLFTRNDKRVTYGGYKGGFNSAACRAGLPDFGPHQLRHGFASALLADNVPITDVAKFLGHKDVNITFGIYGHLVPDAFDRSRAALEALG